MSPPFDLSVYLVTDTAMCQPLGVAETVRRSVAGGATLVQLRDPHCSDEEFIALGRELVDVLHGTGVPLILNDRAWCVEAIGAQGVHVGQSDMPPQQARRLLGPDAIIGFSVTDERQLAAVSALPAGTVDYLGLGPLRATSSKPNHAEPTGFTRLSALARVSTVPVCAIGGVKAGDAKALRACGLDGLAVISAICGQLDPQAATTQIADAWTAAPRVANVLSIAGSDPSGGAGIQADLKAFSANGAYGMCVITALTAQNTRGVCGVHPVPVDFVRAQLDAILDDVRVDAVKIGMLASAELTHVVGEYLAGPLRRTPVVLDPVMVATSGDRLLDDDAVAELRILLPLADLITPNLPEAAVLLDAEPARTLEELIEQAQALHGLGIDGVYAKGGHLLAQPGTEETGDVATDVVLVEGEQVVLNAPFVDTPNTHGTGCSLSSALAALRPQRPNWVETARDAKAWIAGAIAAGDRLEVGSGHGPVHHFHELWSNR